MDKELHNLIKRFEKDNHLIVKDGCLVQQLVKKPYIRKLRQTDKLIVAHDRAKNLTLFFKKPQL